MVKLNLANVRLGQTVAPLVSGGHLLNAKDSLLWLQLSSGLRGWTYTFHPGVVSRLRFDRLIVGTLPSGVILPDYIKLAANSHVKAYFTKTEALVGSYNLTFPTIEDFCILTTHKPTLTHLWKEFNRQWRLLA